MVSVQNRIKKRALPAALGHALLSRAMHISGRSIILLLLTFPCQAQQLANEKNSAAVSGWTIEHWYIFTSLYTLHFEPEPDHVNNQKLLGVETHMENNWLFGLANFDNSFGQNSQYLYAGYLWDLFSSEHWYFKLTGGLLHGYKEPFQDKIPLNDLGVAPAILPTLGFRYKFFVTEVNLLGNAAVTVTAGISF